MTATNHDTLNGPIGAELSAALRNASVALGEAQARVRRGEQQPDGIFLSVVVDDLLSEADRWMYHAHQWAKIWKRREQQESK